MCEEAMLAYLEERLTKDSLMDSVIKDEFIEPLSLIPSERQLKFCAQMLNLTDIEGNMVDDFFAKARLKGLKEMPESRVKLPGGEEFWEAPRSEEKGIAFHDGGALTEVMPSISDEDVFRFNRMYHCKEFPVHQVEPPEKHYWTDFIPELLNLPPSPPPDPLDIPEIDEDFETAPIDFSAEATAEELSEMKLSGDDEEGSGGEKGVKAVKEVQGIKKEKAPKEEAPGVEGEGEFFAFEVEESTDEEGEDAVSKRDHEASCSRPEEVIARTKLHGASVRAGCALETLLEMEDDPLLELRHPLLKERGTKTPRRLLRGRYDRDVLEAEVERIQKAKEAEESNKEVLPPLPPGVKTRSKNRLEAEYLRRLAGKSSEWRWDGDGDDDGEEGNPNRSAPMLKPRLPEKKTGKPQHSKKKRDPHNKKNSWKMMANVFKD